MLPLAAYAAALVVPAMAIAGLLLGGAWTAMLPLVVFGAVPLAELFLTGTTDNPGPEDERKRRGAWAFDAVLYAQVPLQWTILGIYLWGVSQGSWVGGSLVGATATAGLACGSLGINVAHELGHRPQTAPRWASWALLLSTHYLHFSIEHNRGHHARVATPDDPATARLGETVFAFWVRSIRDSWRSAWALEDHRLRKLAHPRRSPNNMMVRFTAVQVLSVLGVGLVLGPVTAGAWLVVSLIGILLLETVNYVEHYGLQREQLPNGRYARTRPAHSWNSERPLGRVLLLDVTRHSDHHAHASRPYPVLRHHEAAPELPAGYPGMILLALCPPLWFRVMDPRVAGETARVQRAEAA